MILSKRVKYIKIISISLFFFSFFSLVASLWLQNTLADFKFTKTADFKRLETANLISKDINCSKNLDICRISDFKILKDTQRLGDCYPYEVEIEYFIEENKIIKDHSSLFVNGDVKKGKLKPDLNDKNIEIVFKKINKKKPSCIKNNQVYNLYKIFPFYHEFLYALKNNPKTTLGASEQINPFIYGESSISNIVKRYPINYIFKSLLYISVIFMFLYWVNYNILFKEVLNTKNNTFVYYGIISAIFLFLKTA